MADLNEIADSLSSLTILEAAELATILEEKWGVSAAAPVAVAAAAGPAAEAAEEGEREALLREQLPQHIPTLPAALLLL